jgi:hypothetical protein
LRWPGRFLSRPKGPGEAGGLEEPWELFRSLEEAAGALRSLSELWGVFRSLEAWRRFEA